MEEVDVRVKNEKVVERGKMVETGIGGTITTDGGGNAGEFLAYACLHLIIFTNSFNIRVLHRCNSCKRAPVAQY